LVEIRLQKILSSYGYGSRRDCEELIRDRRVKVNGKVAELGQKADPQKDQIELDNKVVSQKEFKEIYIAFYKPRKVLSDIKKIDDRKIVTDFIPIKQHLFIVGRLDFDSEGLILLTNNGEIANKLTHPRYEHEKEYHVQLGKIPDAEQIEIWKRGVVIESGYQTKQAIVEALAGKPKSWLRIVMKEGKKRQIRETGMTIGLPIKRIIRKRIASVNLGSLEPGEWRYLSQREVTDLKKTIN